MGETVVTVGTDPPSSYPCGWFATANAGGGRLLSVLRNNLSVHLLSTAEIIPT